MDPFPAVGGMRAALLLDAEFQDAEAIYPLYRLKEAGYAVDVLGRDKGLEVVGKWGYHIRTTKDVGKAKAKDYQIVVVPGGNAPDKMRTYAPFVDFVRDADSAGCTIAAICHGPELLIDAEVVAGKRLTSYVAIRKDLQNAGAQWEDAEAIADANLVTARTPDDLPAFMAATLLAARHLEAMA